MEQEEKLVWEDPPLRRNSVRHGLWLKRLQPFVENPGRWGRVVLTGLDRRVAVQSLAQGLRSRKIAIPEPDGNWTFTQRTLPDNTVGLWVKYEPRDEKT